MKTSATLEAPFEIGEVFWQAISHPRQVEVTCPVCFGKLAVVVELGDGERVPVECDACALGFSRARGVIDEWQNEPAAEPFTIREVKSFYDGEWTVASETSTITFSHLFRTQEQALATARARVAEQQAQNYDRRQRSRKVHRIAWTVRYHRECIATAEREIAWHKSRLASSRLPPAKEQE